MIFLVALLCNSSCLDLRPTVGQTDWRAVKKEVIKLLDDEKYWLEMRSDKTMIGEGVSHATFTRFL